MPSPRAALIDIEELGLSHNESHTLVGTRLAKTKNISEEKILKKEEDTPVFASINVDIKEDEVSTIDQVEEVNTSESPIEVNDTSKKKKNFKKKK